jgi:hypothetical protein
MRLTRHDRFITSLALLAAAGGASLLWRGQLRGQGSGTVTWSGRIHIERRETTSNRCTDCEYDIHDFNSEQSYFTEYQVERLPQRADAEWSSADVRVQVRGTTH